MVFFHQRALPIRILWVGKRRSRGVELVFDEYVQKLKLYCNVDDVQIRSNPKNARYFSSYCVALIRLNVNLLMYI